MRKVLAALGSAVFLVLAPGIVAGFVPWWIAHGTAAAPRNWLLETLGILLMACGAAALFDSFARFALQGLGTPAPVFRTRHLVVTGLYRHVRNPMYLAVAAAILGQSLWFGNVRVLVYGFAVWLAFHLFVTAYEEPTLRRTYGREYEEFCANVPRWIPRVRPWNPRN
jgi:protein-S-isoprenylcysteine O-methyltransferase Ste14